MEKRLVLEIGSGVQYYKPKEDEEVIYSDMLPFPQVKKQGVQFDLNTKPYPFDNNTFDKVVANHTLEHVKEIYLLMEEMHRICKLSGVFEIEVPFFSSSLQHTSLDHRNFFGWTTFDDFDPELRKSIYDSPLYVLPKWKVEKRKLLFGRHKLTKKLNWLINPIINRFPRFYQRFLCWVFPCEIIRYRLVAIK